MLLLFPGELTERFLLWLMEPPMATAESVSARLQMLRSSVSFTSAAPPLHTVLLGHSEASATSDLMTD